jgi:hypothetical protein
MCLYFNDKDIETTLKLRKGKKPIIAYKILCSYGGALISPMYYDFSKRGRWIPGEVKRSNRKFACEPNNMPTNTELGKREIEGGTHCYKTREISREAMKAYWGWMAGTKQIWKVEINPKDVVMVGGSLGKALVATKVKLLERVR